MKTAQIVGSFTLLFSLALAVAPPPVIPPTYKEKIIVSSEGIRFRVYRYGDGRKTPYKISFKDDGVRSTYRFLDNGAVNSVRVDYDKYRVLYMSNGDLKRVRQIDGLQRRNLAEDAEDFDEDLEDYDEEDTASASVAHRSLYDCDHCVEAWDAVCDEGVPTVCDLMFHGPPFSDVAMASIQTLCNKFGSACSASGGMEACQGQCEEADCAPSLYVTLDWYNDGGNGGGVDMDLHVIEPRGMEVDYSNECGDFGYFGEDHSDVEENEIEEYTMYSDMAGDAMLGEYIVYGVWYDAYSPYSSTDITSVPYVLTAYSGGVVVWKHEGELFPPSITSTEDTVAISSPDVTTPRFTVSVADYERNDSCENSRDEASCDVL